MQIELIALNNADSSRATKDLKEALASLGIPRDALSTTPKSTESMDLGSILAVEWQVASQIMGSAADIIAVSHAIFSIAKRYRASVMFKSGKKKILRSATEISSPDQIESAIKETLK